jgi:hypothetical protein
VVLRALVLLRLAKGTSAPRIAEVVPLTPQAIRKMGHLYQQGGLEVALYDKPRPGAQSVLDESQKQGSSLWCAAIRQKTVPAGRCA